jgi:uncharacterized protein with von Willebrand factor type A (vWA) domain
MPSSEDHRPGKLADNLVDFGRALRRAGVQSDSMRFALAARAAMLVGIESRHDFAAALEIVMVSREQDRLVFRELFDAWFGDPDLDQGGPGNGLPGADGDAHEVPVKLRPRVREALAAAPTQALQPPDGQREVDPDASMSMSDRHRLHHADFNALGAAEYRLVERLARDVALPVPTVASRRLRATGASGSQSRIDWAGVWRERSRTGGEMLLLPRMSRRRQPLPLLVLVDVSGSMERYARLLMAFLHAATRRTGRRDVFAFGTRLTDLTQAFHAADADAMLAAASEAIEDFAGGTRLGESLGEMRMNHARRLTGRRTLTLIVSDGLDTGEPEVLERELLWLKRHSRRVLWLNPLLRYDGYAPVARGAAVLDRHVDAMLAVHNLSALEQLAAGLAALIRK